MGNPDLSLKSGILDLAIEREMHNWLHPHLPPPPAPTLSREILPQIMTLWVSFIPFLSRTSEKKTVKLFSWTVSFFCLLCMRVRDNCSVKNSSKSSLVSPHPPPPAPCLKKRERKENQGQAYLRWNPFSDFASFDPNFKNPSPNFTIKYAGPNLS